MDDLDIVEAFENMDWNLVALNSNEFQWQSGGGGKSPILRTAEEVVDFAKTVLSVIDKQGDPASDEILSEHTKPDSHDTSDFAKDAAVTAIDIPRPARDSSFWRALAQEEFAAIASLDKKSTRRPVKERIRCALEALADAYDEGELPESLFGLHEKAEVMRLIAVADPPTDAGGIDKFIRETLAESGIVTPEQYVAVRADLLRILADWSGSEDDRAAAAKAGLAGQVSDEGTEISAPPVIPSSGAQLIAVDLIRLDGGTQMRVEPLNMIKVAEYAELMRAGKEFPAVDVFFDGDNYWLGDGFYRHAATQAAEIEEILATIHEGTQRDAILFAVGANATHGIPRTAEDKRKAVEKLLYDDEWRTWTNSRIAEAAGVSDPFVKKIRDNLTLIGLESPAVRVAKDGRKIDTTHIGDRESAAQLSAAQPILPGAEAAVAEVLSDEPFIDDTRRAADFEIADPDGSLELESNAREEEEARRDFDPVNEANADEAARDEKRAQFSELLDAVRDKPNGMKLEELFELGISHEQIEEAKRLRFVEKHVNGRIFYQWHPEDIVAAIRKHGPLNRFQLEDEHGCQSWVINAAKGRVIQQTEDGAFILMEPAEQPASAQVEVASDAAAVRAEIEEGRKGVSAASQSSATPLSAQPAATPTQAPAVTAPVAAVSWPEQHLIINLDIKAGKSSKRGLTISGRAGDGAPVFLSILTLADLEPMPPALAVLVARLGGISTPVVETSAAEAAPAKAPAKKGATKTPAKRAPKKSAATTKKSKGAKSKQSAKQARG